MFARLRRLWSINTHIIAILPSLVPPSPSDSPPSTPRGTQVYIWKTTPKTVGHAAMEVGGDYVSFHPNGIPAIGPTAFVPLPPSLAENKEEDAQLAALEANKAISCDYSDVSFQSPIPLPEAEMTELAPDYIFEVPDLDIKKMQACVESIREKIARGERGYQLFPNINLLGFLTDAWRLISQDPTELLTPLPSRTTGTSVDNCSTLVTKILKSGGSPVISSERIPWGISPNELAEQLRRQGIPEQIKPQ